MEEKEGTDIGKYVNWGLTIILILVMCFALYQGYFKNCNCQATYDLICNVTNSNSLNGVSLNYGN